MHDTTLITQCRVSVNSGPVLKKDFNKGRFSMFAAITSVFDPLAFHSKAPFSGSGDPAAHLQLTAEETELCLFKLQLKPIRRDSAFNVCSLHLCVFSACCMLLCAPDHQAFNEICVDLSGLFCRRGFTVPAVWVFLVYRIFLDYLSFNRFHFCDFFIYYFIDLRIMGSCRAAWEVWEENAEKCAL